MKLIVIFSLFLILVNCNVIKLGKGVKKDFTQREVIAKEYWKGIYFKGLVEQKIDSHRIVIRLIEFSKDSVPIGFCMFPKRYNFNSTKPTLCELWIKNKDIFKNSKSGDTLVKHLNSTCILYELQNDTICW